MSAIINSSHVDNPESEFSNSPKSFHNINQLVDDSLRECNTESLNFDFTNTYNSTLLSNHSNFCSSLRQFNSNEIQFNTIPSNEMQFNSTLVRTSSNEDKNIPLKKRKVDYIPRPGPSPPLLMMGIAEVLEQKKLSQSLVNNNNHFS